MGYREVDAMDLGSSLDGVEGEDTEIFRLLFFKDFYSLFNFEREREHKQGRGRETERGRERENPKQAPRCQHRP